MYSKIREPELCNLCMEQRSLNSSRALEFSSLHNRPGTWDDSVGIRTLIRAERPRYQNLTYRRYADCFLVYCLETCSEVHPASYPKTTKGAFPEIKQTEHKADFSPLSSAEMKIE
jgi:hypothetical protein